MKICIVTDVLGAENNGTTTTIKRLIEGMEAKGHEVRVVSAMLSDKENYYTLPIRSFGLLTGYIVKNGVELAKPVESIIRKAIEGVDVVHIPLAFKTGRKAMKLCQEMKIPFTTAIHSQAENITSHLFLKNCEFLNRIIYRRWYNIFFKYAHFIHCPTQFIANELQRNKFKNFDFRIVSNGVTQNYIKNHAQKPEDLKDKFVITFVARHSNEKRHDILIKAIKKSKYADKIQLVLGGSGPITEKLKKLGSTLPNPPIMKFFSKTELVDLLNYADLYIHPSEIEIEAISCLEAIACGQVPIISNSAKSATKAFALNESNLFKMGDAKNLAEKIDYFIEHPEELARQKKQYDGFTAQYSISNSIDKMEKLFLDAIEYYKDENNFIK